MVIVAIFGTHLILTMFFMCLFYAFLYTAMRHFGKVPRHSAHYQVLNGNIKVNEKDEKLDLLNDERFDTSLEDL